MQVIDCLQHRISDEESVNRVELLSSHDDNEQVSAVFIRVPPKHEFPFHVHPNSEDCFFILSGSGEVFDTEKSFSVSGVSGVWVPPGVPHGLSASASGVIEIGFQSPSGPTLNTSESSSGNESQGVVTASISSGRDQVSESNQWLPIFINRIGWKYFNPHYCSLKKSQQIQVAAEDYELFVVVVRGSLQFNKQAENVGAIAMVHLKVGESEVCHALEEDTLLLGVRVYSA